MQLSELSTLTCKVYTSVAGFPQGLHGIYGLALALHAVPGAAVYLPLVIVVDCIGTSHPGLRGGRFGKCGMCCGEEEGSGREEGAG